MKIDKRNYADLVVVLNNGIENILSGEPDSNDKRAVKKAQNLIEKMGYKPVK